MEPNHKIKQFLHDIKSPIQALKLIQEGHLDELEEKDILLQKCFDRIKSLSQLNEATDKRIKWYETNIANTFKNFKSLKELELSKTIITKIKITQPWVLIPLPELELFEILSNLTNNAFNAQTKDSIIIKVEQRKSHLKIDIIDSGRGIDQNKLLYLGNPGASFTKEGQGLGLSDAIKKIKSANGDITCRSIPNIGTKMSLTIPLKE